MHFVKLSKCFINTCSNIIGMYIHFVIYLYEIFSVQSGREKSSGTALKLSAKSPKPAEEDWGGDFGNEFVSTEDSGLPMAGEYNWGGESNQGDFFSSAMGLPKVGVCCMNATKCMLLSVDVAILF